MRIKRKIQTLSLLSNGGFNFIIYLFVSRKMVHLDVHQNRTDLCLNALGCSPDRMNPFIPFYCSIVKKKKKLPENYDETIVICARNLSKICYSNHCSIKKLSVSHEPFILLYSPSSVPLFREHLWQYPKRKI